MNTPLPAGAAASARFGFLALAFAGSLAAQTPAAPPTDQKKDQTVTIEKFEVTGSRIKRLDYETASPVVTYTAQAIEDKGLATLGEFVQSLPYNNSTAVSEFTTGSFITGAATINPRGLGSNPCSRWSTAGAACPTPSPTARAAPRRRSSISTASRRPPSRASSS
jgi:outer membrane receptor protein involved in Fe transport